MTFPDKFTKVSSTITVIVSEKSPDEEVTVKVPEDLVLNFPLLSIVALSESTDQEAEGFYRISLENQFPEPQN